MDQAKAGFVATVSLRTREKEVKESLTPRAAFWRPVQVTMPAVDAGIRTAEELEDAVITVFPRALHRLLLQHFASSAIRGDDLVTRHPQDLDGVFFRVSFEGYGSALLAVDVGGARELGEFVKGNLDTFTMLMEAFVPAAFANSIPSPHRASDFVATIAPTAELQRIFAQQGQSPTHEPQVQQNAGTASASTGEDGAGWFLKVPRALLATAFSLLTPVLLSLIVLYCAAQMLLEERSELTKRESILVSQEQDLRKTERAAAADLQKENVELIRMLRAPPAAVVPSKP